MTTLAVFGEIETVQLDCIDANGTVLLLDGVGLGVDYDWDFIDCNWTAHFVYI